MSGVKRFLLDANIFIQAFRSYYSFRVCPGFWDALVRQHEAKRVTSIDKVKDELEEISDELSDWVRESAPDSFLKELQIERSLRPTGTSPTGCNVSNSLLPKRKRNFCVEQMVGSSLMPS